MQAVRRIRLLCTKYDEVVRLHHPPVSIRSHFLPITPMLHSRKLFKFGRPIHCWTSQRSSSRRLPMWHPACPTFVMEIHDMAGKFPMFRSASFCPCFYVTCSHHFSHALIPDMQNFVPRIPPSRSRLELQPNFGSKNPMEIMWVGRRRCFIW